MRNKLLALLLAIVVAAAGVGGWLYSRSRVVKVWVYTDPAFRVSHENWPDLIASRFNEANRLYALNGLKIRWQVLDSSELDPTNKIPGIDDRRANMVFHQDKKTDIYLIYTGIQEHDRTGSVNPFANVAVIVDLPNKSEAVNARSLAHELAHLFGAPHDPAWLETMMNEKPESSRFAPRTIALIQQMRNYPFAMGIDGLSQGSWDKKALAALAEDDTAPNSNPASHAQTVLGTALLNERKKELALVHFKAAVQADPKSVGAKFNLAEAYTRDGQDEQALQELQIAARMEPNNPETRILLAIQQCNQYGHLDDGIASFQEALRLAPSSAVAAAGLQKAQDLKVRLQEELTKDRAAVKSDPKNADAHYRLGKVEARAGDFSAAIQDIQKAADGEPNNGTPHVELAELFFLKGDVNSAWVEVAKARQLGAEPPATLISRLGPKK